MKKIKGIAVLLLLIVSTALFAQQPIVFKLAFTDPPYLKIGDLQVLHHSVAGMVAFKAAVENMTQKRVVVENYYYGRLGDANENIRQILTGTLQGLLLRTEL
jgi:TRAP-type C4-dicarboxylate transport system substrate-binding protein